MTVTARDQLVALYMVGANVQAMSRGEALPYGPDFFAAKSEPKVDPEYTEGFEFAKNGGKMKLNPYEGGSRQWWSWHDGYKAAKKQQADALRPGAGGTNMTKGLNAAIQRSDKVA